MNKPVLISGTCRPDVLITDSFMTNRCIYAIADFYGDKRAERSQVPYMNHIYEGIKILRHIKAHEHAEWGYCLHPLFQSDESLVSVVDGTCWNIIEDNELPTLGIIYAMEYRKMANSYLSKDKKESLSKSPCPVVWDMLRADKVQNRKDFEAHHKQTHPRSKELKEYFNNWMEILSISEDKYQELVKVMVS